MSFNETYKKYVSSRDYEYAKIIFLKYLKSDKNLDIFKKINEFRKGKTYIEIYGIEKAKNIKRKQSKSIKGKTLGRKHSKEEIEKRTKSLIGKKQTKETKEKIRQSLLGIKHTEERKANNSKSHLGQIAWNKGIGKVSKKVEQTIIKLHITDFLIPREIGEIFECNARKIIKILKEQNSYIEYNKLRKLKGYS